MIGVHCERFDESILIGFRLAARMILLEVHNRIIVDTLNQKFANALAGLVFSHSNIYRRVVGVSVLFLILLILAY